MTYNPEAKNYEMPGATSDPTPAVLGYPDDSHLPDSAPLLATFNAFGFDPAGIEAFLNPFSGGMGGG